MRKPVLVTGCSAQRRKRTPGGGIVTRRDQGASGATLMGRSADFAMPRASAV